MALTQTGSETTAESGADLELWLTRLEGCPQVTDTLLLACREHGEERPTWMYVEADAANGVARRRCLPCGTSVALLDSADRWTHPPMWACPSCTQSIAEVAVGMHVPDGKNVQWVVVAVRCVECGRVAGLTDIVVDRMPLELILPTL